ncbi:hypothetical protein D915_000113 [Fasciola hepatica]|uniref:c-SKI SMAD4-binding domain-containing protein n=1 Tax=Fasciola hepatica TaxID=6192 RepID=A0A4E0RS77_FASHE|nr:hypothetical protein D915_000113 [Fasciola hepatica]
MTFSIKNNPYLTMYPQPPPAPSSDCASPRKATGFRQSLPTRLQGLPGLDIVNMILASYRANKTKPDAVPPPHLSYPPANPFLASPGWFQQALVNSLLLPRPFVDDTCLPAPPVRPPGLAGLTSPKLPRPMPSSPVTSKSRTSSCDSVVRMDKDTSDPLLYCRPTFYPLLKDQVDRAHCSWRTSDPKHQASPELAPETGTLVPSLIDGEVIMGFNVWGEKRLCLPHLFRFVLNDVDLKAIDEACTKLQITCTTCTPAQLKLLHSRRILPKAVSTCGLIRKSDAERLTKYIRNRADLADRVQASTRLNPGVSRSHSGSELEVIASEDQAKQPYPAVSRSGSLSLKRSQEMSDNHSAQLDLVGGNECVRKRDDSVEPRSDSDDPIPVLHECFGRQSGLIHPELYTEPTAKCIECQTCHRLFAPDQFVGHTHTVTEVDNLNHWGFDSNNWRCYLRLYTGRHGRVVKPDTGWSQCMDVGSEDELENSPPKDCTVTSETHRRLEEFKIKFAQPIRLPPSLSAALRTVGLCASVAPIPPSAIFSPHPTHEIPESHTPNAPDHLIKNTSFTALQPLTTSRELNRNPTIPMGPLSSSTSTPAPIPPPLSSSRSSVLLPQLTLRRLWAPNDGRIKVPPPPKPNATRDKNVLPKKLHTGPPVLLHSHRVVSQAAADQYDRDFIPNVCLMPPVGSKYRKSSCGSRGRHHRLSRDCSCRHRHARDLSSGSRSHSRSRSCSSGSSGSRTRSASVSSTTSSCYSRGRSCKRYCHGGSHSPCSPGSRSCSTTSSVHVDEPGKPYFAKKTHYRCLTAKTLSNSSTRSNSSSRKGSRRRSHHLRRICRRRYRSASYPRPNASVQLAHVRPRRVRSASAILIDIPDTPCVGCQRQGQQTAPKTSTCSITSRLKSLCSPVQSDQSCLDRPHQHKYRRHHHHTHHQRNQCQNRALAAAKAAQGAASRISPGLWSRHFANLKGNNGTTLELPNARQPATMDAASSSPNSTTPVLVTGPSTNSLPSAVLALESLWTDLVRHMNEFTSAVESRTGVQDARQRLFEQFVTMQTCYATHIAGLVSENQKLYEKLSNMCSSNSNSVSTEGTMQPKEPSVSACSQSWSRTNETQHESATRGTVQLSTKTIQSSQPIYPHRSRKEPQPIRTQFCIPVGSTSFLNANNRLVPPDRSDRKSTPDGWPRSSGSNELQLTGSPQMSCSEPSARKFPRLSSADKSVSERSSDHIPNEETPSVSLSCPPSAPRATLRTNDAVSIVKKAPDISVGSSGSENSGRLLPVHSSSAAPYKVSSGLCDRRLSEKYGAERVHWKRRPWDMDLQAESNGTLNLSIQSAEPMPKRRVVAISDNNTFE